MICEKLKKITNRKIRGNRWKNPFQQLGVIKNIADDAGSRCWVAENHEDNKRRKRDDDEWQAAPEWQEVVRVEEIHACPSRLAGSALSQWLTFD